MYFSFFDQLFNIIFFGHCKISQTKACHSFPNAPGIFKHLLTVRNQNIWIYYHIKTKKKQQMSFYSTDLNLVSMFPFGNLIWEQILNLIPMTCFSSTSKADLLLSQCSIYMSSDSPHTVCLWLWSFWLLERSRVRGCQKCRTCRPGLWAFVTTTVMGL